MRYQNSKICTKKGKIQKKNPFIIGFYVYLFIINPQKTKNNITYLFDFLWL